MNSKFEDLKQTIHIKNEFNRIAGAILEHVKTASLPFIGKKIDTQKGLTEKYRQAINVDRDSIDVKPLPGTKWAKLHHCYVSTSFGNELTLKLSLCFSDGKTGCTYEENTFWFGKVENTVLTSINMDVKVSNRVLDFDTELAAIKEYVFLLQKAEDAREKINVYRDHYKYIGVEDFK